VPVMVGFVVQQFAKEQMGPAEGCPIRSWLGFVLPFLGVCAVGLAVGLASEGTG